MTSISVRVHFVNGDHYKILRLNENKVLGELIKDIKEERGGGEDYSFFVQGNKESGEKSFWVDEKRSLKSYNIKNNTTIQFKKKIRPVNVRLVDGTVKKIMIDESFTVRELTDMIGEKIGIKSAEEFSLRLPTPPEMAKAPHWLQEAQTLHEQDVGPDQELEYAKKLYFSDGYIDANDPFTLHLLFVEANKAIVDGKYPVNQDQARDFAALQMQVFYGDHKVEKHKIGFLDPNTFLPRQYRKDKKLEKDIYQEHRRLIGTKEMQAKMRYVQGVRSLKTYGITFFECQMKQKSKKGKVKFVPILIGVTREKIIKVDPSTQEVLREWKWNQMRRWSAIKGGGLTLDFGDYEDDYVTIFTEEFSALSALISSYIDIILKSRADVAPVPEEEEVQFANEDELEPGFGIPVSGYTHPSHPHYGKGLPIDPAMLGNQYAHNHPSAYAYGLEQFPRAMRVNVVDLPSALRAVEYLSEEIPVMSNVQWGQPPTAVSEQEWAQHYDIHKTAVLKAAEELLGHAKLGPGHLNRQVIEPIAVQLSTDLRNMTTAAKGLSILNPEKIPELDGAQAVASSITDLLKLLLGTLNEDTFLMEEFETALEGISQEIQNAEYLVEQASLINHTDRGANLLLLESINNVETKMNNFLEAAKMVAASVPLSFQQQLYEDISKLTALAPYTVHNLHNLAPYALDPKVRQQLQMVQTKFEGLRTATTRTFLSHIPPSHKNLESNLFSSAEQLTTALTTLLQATNTVEKVVFSPDANLHTPALKMLEAIETLKEELEVDSKSLNLNLKTLTAFDKDITQATQVLSEKLDTNTGNRLTLASVQMTGELKQLINAAKTYHQNPTLESKDHVLVAANALEERCHLLLEDFGKITALNELRYNAKVNAASLLRLVDASVSATAMVNNPALKTALFQTSEKVKQQLPFFLSTVCGASSQPNNFVAQSKLLETSKSLVPCFSELSATAKKAARVITDKPTQQSLDYASNETTKDLKLLMSSIIQLSDISGFTAQDEALAEFDAVSADYDSALALVTFSALHPLPDQTRDNAVSLFDTAAQQLVEVINTIELTLKEKQTVPGQLIREAALTNAQMAVALRSLSGTVSTAPAIQRKILGQGKELSDTVFKCICMARLYSLDPKNTENRREFEKTRKHVDTLLSELTSQIKKMEENEVVSALGEIKRAITTPKRSDGTITLPQATEELKSGAKAVTAAVSQLVSTAQVMPQMLGQSAQVAGTTTANMIDLIEIAADVAQNTSDADLAALLLARARDLAENMSRMIPSAQLLAQKKNTTNQQKLNQDVESVQDSLNGILSALSKDNEAEQASHRIKVIVSEIDSGKLSCIPGCRQDILGEILSASKELIRLQKSLIIAAKSGQPQQLPALAQEAVTSLSKILIACKSSELSTNPAECQIMDTLRIKRGTEWIIKNPQPSARLHAVAKQINRAAGNLIVLAKEKARDEQDPVKRQNIITQTQNVIQSATLLAEAAQKTSKPEDLKKCAQRMQEHTLALESTLFHSQPTRDTNAVDIGVGRALATTSRTLVSNFSELITQTSLLAANPQSKKSTDAVNASDAEAQRALENLLQICGTLNPLVQRCDRAIDTVVKAAAEIEAATLAVIIGKKIPVICELSIKEVQNEALQLCKSVSSDICELTTKTTFEEHTKTMAKFEKNIPELSKYVRAIVAALPPADTASRAQTLTLTHLLLSHMGDLLGSVKGIATNDPRERHLLTKHADAASKALGLLHQRLQSHSELNDSFDRIAASVVEALSQLSSPSTPVKTYADIREALVAVTRKMSEEITSVSTCDKRQVMELSASVSKLAELVPHLVKIARVCSSSAAAVAGTDGGGDVPRAILSSAKQVGDSIIELIVACKDLADGGSGGYSEVKLKNVLEKCNNTTVALSKLLAAGKRGAIAELEMERAHTAIESTISKLRVADVFSRAGQLYRKKTNDKVASPPELTAASLVKALKKLGATLGTIKTTSPEDLGKLSTTIAAELSSAVDLAIQCASQLPDSVAQREIIVAAADLSADVAALITTTKNTQIGTKNQRQNAAKELLNGYRNVVSKLGGLYAAVQASPSDKRAVKYLEMTKQRILSLLDNIPGDASSTPADTVKAAREVLLAMSEFTIASNTEHVVDSAKALFVGMEKLLNHASGIADTMNNSNNVAAAQLASAMMKKIVEVGQAVCALLVAGKGDREDPATREQLEEENAKVTSVLKQYTDLLAKAFPNESCLELIDSLSNYAKLAEEELHRCTELVLNVVEKLRSVSEAKRASQASLPSTVEAAAADLAIEKAIVDSAQAIASATAVMMQNAAVAHTDRNNRSRNQRKTLSPQDSLHSKGLISAAQTVVGSVDDLYNAACAVADGRADESQIVEKARSVGAAAGLLMSAASRTSDPNSEAQSKLKSAAEAITKATANLVEAVASLRRRREEEESLKAEESVSSQKVVELEQKMKILKIEKEIERERKKLLLLKRAKQIQ